jgi:hypothetical protein
MKVQLGHRLSPEHQPVARRVAFGHLLYRFKIWQPFRRIVFWIRLAAQVKELLLAHRLGPVRLLRRFGGVGAEAGLLVGEDILQPVAHSSADTDKGHAGAFDAGGLQRAR